MKVLVISGFLGAGKTTFIQELTKRTGRDFVVYENEYGQTDLDADLLRKDAELEVWASTENCICCSGKQDFASSVLTISNTLDPEYLIVEPTGMAKLSSVMDNLKQIGYERIELLDPICILDAWMWQKQRALRKDIFDDQLCSASSIVVSKLGNNHDKLSELGINDLLAHVAPETPLMTKSWDKLPDIWWNELLEKELDGMHSTHKSSSCAQDSSHNHNHTAHAGSHNHDHSAHVHIDQFSLSNVEVPSVAHFLWILDNMVRGMFGQIDRAKGVVRCGNQSVRFDLVGTLWAITGADNAEESGVVFIGPQIDRISLRSCLREIEHR